jgi:hypothetical protein
LTGGKQRSGCRVPIEGIGLMPTVLETVLIAPLIRSTLSETTLAATSLEPFL